MGVILQTTMDNAQMLSGLSLTHFVCIITVALLCRSYYLSESRKLSHIPSVGPSIPLLSYFGALRLLFSAKEMLAEGVHRYRSVFKVSEFLSWMVVVGDRESMEDIRKAPENVLSATAFVEDLTQAPYTFGSKTMQATFHLPILHGVFTKSMPLLFPEVHEEVRDSFRDGIAPTAEWTPIDVQKTIMRIVSRASNRTFVGKPVCQNKDYIDSLVGIAEDTLKVAIMLRPFPSFLKPIVNRIISSIPQRSKKVHEILLPLIRSRREQEKNEGSDYSGKRMDYLTWLMDTAEGEDAADERITAMMLLGNFGATHSTTTTLTMVIYYLAAHPEYMKLIRDEVAEVTSNLGWTKAAIDEMVIMDSFIRETQRIHPGLIVALSRIALQDFTFSNGVTIPKGTVVSASAITNHMDESVFPDPKAFDPLRFVKRAQSDSKSQDLTAISMDMIVFGHGRHTCPGRFFAAMEMKLILAHLVTTYDMRLENEGVRPPDYYVSFAILPNPFTKVLFRKRQS